MPDDPEVASLLGAVTELLESLQRLTALSEALGAATAGGTLSDRQAQQARHELDTTRRGVEHIDTLITRRRQQLRPI